MKGVDLRVERGQVFGLLGPNGSGKTTTLSCALGLLHPTGGTRTVLGEPAKALHRTRGRVGCVSTCRRPARAHDRPESRLPGGLRGHPGGRQMADALERVGLGGFEHRRAGGLSLGQEKRLAIAGAIMGRPELVVLDEPLSGLDPMGVRGMLELLEELAQDGQTLIVSSHRLHEMESVLTHAAVILDGEVVRQAPLEEYLGRPDSYTIRVRDAEAARRAVAAVRGEIESEAHDGALRSTRPRRARTPWPRRSSRRERASCIAEPGSAPGLVRGAGRRAPRRAPLEEPRDRLLRVLQAELVRICASRAAWLGLALVALIAPQGAGRVLAQRAKEIEHLTGGGGAPGLTEGDGWALLVDGWRAGLMLATALLLVQSARALAGDRETGVFRLAVTRAPPAPAPSSGVRSGPVARS